MPLRPEILESSHRWRSTLDYPTPLREFSGLECSWAEKSCGEEVMGLGKSATQHG